MLCTTITLEATAADVSVSIADPCGDIVLLSVADVGCVHILYCTYYRDVVEVRLELAGVPCIVSDTAGLRSDSSDLIEMEGMRRAR